MSCASRVARNPPSLTQVFCHFPTVPILCVPVVFNISERSVANSTKYGRSPENTLFLSEDGGSGILMACVGRPLLSLSDTQLQSRCQLPRDCGLYPIGLTEGEPVMGRILFLMGSSMRASVYF